MLSRASRITNQYEAYHKLIQDSQLRKEWANSALTIMTVHFSDTVENLENRFWFSDFGDLSLEEKRVQMRPTIKVQPGRQLGQSDVCLLDHEIAVSGSRKDLFPTTSIGESMQDGTWVGTTCARRRQDK